MYDYIIVGAGPTGLTLSWFLANKGKKCLLIESQSHIGGCHGVYRQDGLFSEHAPRIYTEKYQVLNYILKDMGHEWNDIFVQFEFPIVKLIKIFLPKVSIREILIFTKSLIESKIDDNYGRDISVETYLTENKFSDDLKHLINMFCKTTDGGDYFRYSLYELLQAFPITKYYLPRRPNDVLLFKLWRKSLDDTNLVDIKLNTHIKKLNFSRSKNLITSVSDSRGIIHKAENVILALPPKQMMDILDASNCKDAFGDYLELKSWSTSTNYDLYISMTLHWDTKIDLTELVGWVYGIWGIFGFIMSDYMNFDDKRSKTVFSLTLINPSVISPYIGFDSYHCPPSMLKNEVIRQMREIVKFPDPLVVISPDISFNKTWSTNITSYIHIPRSGDLDQNSYISNLFNCGTHNGYSRYAFTSMETACSNALYLSEKMI